MNTAEIIGDVDNADLGTAERESEVEKPDLSSPDFTQAEIAPPDLDAADVVGEVQQRDRNAVERFRSGKGIQADARESPGIGADAEIEARDGIVTGTEEVEAEAENRSSARDELEVESGRRGPACSDLQRRKRGGGSGGGAERQEKREEDGKELFHGSSVGGRDVEGRRKGAEWAEGFTGGQ